MSSGGWLCGKLCLTKKDAESALKLATVGKQYRKEKRSYYCRKCRAWHLTSKEDNKDIETVEIKSKAFRKYLRY